ncbi:hypothetical protein J2847_001323 [Azospirillum agricola]|uniref:hypothetical protein n=1 Tax=Azospirillum agricola TaxID=1720247 RepID=UPI001AE28A31|nr:hypothetical protein [Azospirillum agricola]MBP2228041.1 hypothetical protein [Azospirillum agricola]
MRRLLLLCLGLLALLTACGPIYDTQYSLIPPTSIEGRNCVSQCQQNRSICRQTCTIGQQSCLNEARSRALYEYQAYVERQTAEKKPIKRSISSFENTYACGANSCEQRCDADYRDCFGSVCGGQVIAQKVCTAFCDQPPAATAPALAAAPPAAMTGGPMSVPAAPDDRSLCRRGMRVEVQWKGDWYPATVKGPLRGDGRCPIHYDEYGSEDDEAVSLQRIRPR